MANVYYAIGQNTDDHKTGSPTATISSGIMTFSIAQTHAQMGVGDKVVTAAATVYISGKVSTTQWNVVTALGATPADDATPRNVTSIAHEYTSMSAAEAGAVDANHLNNTDITAAGANVNLFFPLYYDSAADTTKVVMTGYTTDATHRIKYYTPWNIYTECNTDQRFGYSMTGGYQLTPGTAGAAIIIYTTGYIDLEGIYFGQFAGSVNGDAHVQGYNTAGNTIKNCVMRGLTNNAIYPHCITFFNSGSGGSVDIINCVLIGTGGSSNLQGMQMHYNTGGVVNVYNTVIYGMSSVGINNTTASQPATLVIKNTVSFSNTGADYSGTQSAGTNYNRSGDGTHSGANSASLTNETVTNYFISATNFHINIAAANIADIKGAGTDLTASGRSADIDSRTIQNTAAVDIGASQYHWGQTGAKINGVNARRYTAKINGVNTETIKNRNGVIA